MLARGHGGLWAVAGGVRKESLHDACYRGSNWDWAYRRAARKAIRGKIMEPLGDFSMMTGDAGMPPKTDTVAAVRWSGVMDAEGFPPEAAWEAVPGVQFDWDWQGANADATRETQVRLLWTPETLFVEFRAKYRNITVYDDADSRGWRDKLWDKDVCEMFLQSDPSQPRKYQEFEVAPNGNWIDLAIDLDGGEHRGKRDLTSGLKRRASVDEARKTWRAVLALPMKSVVSGRFDPSQVWRVNFFRVEGPSEPRFYASWQPTKTPQPSFHVPEVFGRLVFK